MGAFSKLKQKIASVAFAIRSVFAQRKALFDSMMLNVSKGQSGAGDIIGALIAVVIGVTLYPVVSDTVADVNASGIEQTLLDLIPTLYVIGVIVGAIAWMGLRRMGK